MGEIIVYDFGKKHRPVATINDAAPAPSENDTKLATWNVRGIGACARKGGLDALIEYAPDVICLQEVQVMSEDKIRNLLGRYKYHVTSNLSIDRNHKAGTVLMSREPPIKTAKSFDFDPLVGEGRVITAEYTDYYVVNVYAPAAITPARLRHKLEWWSSLQGYLRQLQTKKACIVCGDFNATASDRDADSMIDPDSPGCTYHERRMLQQLNTAGFSDAYRIRHPRDAGYTWHVPHNQSVGMRLDYIYVSNSIMNTVVDVARLTDIRTSDHVPLLMSISK